MPHLSEDARRRLRQLAGLNHLNESDDQWSRFQEHGEARRPGALEEATVLSKAVAHALRGHGDKVIEILSQLPKEELKTIIKVYGRSPFNKKPEANLIYDAAQDALSRKYHESSEIEPGALEEAKYKMWTGPTASKQVAAALKKIKGVSDVVAGTEHVIFRCSDLDALRAKAPPIVKAHLKALPGMHHQGAKKIGESLEERVPNELDERGAGAPVKLKDQHADAKKRAKEHPGSGWGKHAAKLRRKMAGKGVEEAKKKYTGKTARNLWHLGYEAYLGGETPSRSDPMPFVDGWNAAADDKLHGGKTKFKASAYEGVAPVGLKITRRLAFEGFDDEDDARWAEDRKGQEYLDKHLKKPGKKGGWWLPPHNLLINQALMGMNLWHFRYDISLREEGIVVRPMWTSIDSGSTIGGKNMSGFAQINPAIAANLVKLVKQQPTIESTVQKELDDAEHKFGMKIPPAFKSKILKDAVKVAGRRWGVNRLRTNKELIPYDGSKKRKLSSWGF